MYYVHYPMNNTSSDKHSNFTTGKIIRNLLLLIFVAGLLGAGVELLLLEHFEVYWQFVPLILICGSLVVLGWFAFKRVSMVLRVLQIVMILFMISGCVGVILHYRVNVEFELEMYPSLSGLELFWKSIKGATPFLAPGIMIQLGLLRSVYTFRHPVFRINQKESKLKRENLDDFK